MSHSNMYEVPPTQSFQPPQLQLSTFETHHHVCCLGAYSAKLFVVCADHAKSRPDFVTLPHRTFHHCEKIFDDRTYQSLSFVFEFRLPVAVLYFTSILKYLYFTRLFSFNFGIFTTKTLNKQGQNVYGGTFYNHTSLYLAIKSVTQIESYRPVYVLTIGITMSRFFHLHTNTQIRG